MTGIVGAVPGATVEIRVGTQVRGSAVAVDGTAAVGLSPATGAADILIARQTACGIQGPDTHAPLPVHTDKLLPRPKIVSPLFACRNSVTIEKLLSGAVTNAGAQRRARGERHLDGSQGGLHRRPVCSLDRGSRLGSGRLGPV